MARCYGQGSIKGTYNLGFSIILSLIGNKFKVGVECTSFVLPFTIQNLMVSFFCSAAIRGDNSPRSRWRRAIIIAGRIKDPNDVLVRNTGGQQISAESNQSKILETQHWLELIDGKHRYGSNLKRYHRRWLSEATKDKFFSLVKVSKSIAFNNKTKLRWNLRLDHGAGRDISLPECPRERLESEVSLLT